jgi:hypothetical protein
MREEIVDPEDAVEEEAAEREEALEPEETAEREAPAVVATAGEVHSVAARAPVRSRLAADVEAFLARGGSIEQVPTDHRAEPARHQDNVYGRGAI